MLLVSGLPLGKKRLTSFERQLALLAGSLSKRGFKTSVLGPEPAPILRTAPGRDTCGIVLLGYPDQFRSLLLEPIPGISLFLWAQCSRPPDPRTFGPSLAVPLTPKTEVFLTAAGVARIGPVVPHGVDTGFFHPPDPTERARVLRGLGAQDRFVVGAVGASTRRKRFDLIVESFAQFSTSRADAVLLIKTDRAVGLDGTDLPGMAKKRGIADRYIIIDGEIDDTRMRELYGAMDLFVNLSEWEGFCLPTVEAMSMGVPVLTHGVQGPGELVPYNDLIAQDSAGVPGEGSLLREAQPETVARLMEKAASEQALHARLSALGRAEALRRFDIHGVAGMWESLLESAV